jgi:predicted transcriptional regulator
MDATMTIRLDRETKELIAQMAARDQRSLSNMTRLLIRRAAREQVQPPYTPGRVTSH